LIFLSLILLTVQDEDAKTLKLKHCYEVADVFLDFAIPIPHNTYISCMCGLRQMVLQPHGFFNCSPAIDIPPSKAVVADDPDHKEVAVKGAGQPETLTSTLLSKL
jgi:hypothetical protein